MAKSKDSNKEPKENNKNKNELELLSRNELVKMAKDNKIKNYSRMAKKELIKAINNLKTDNTSDKKSEVSKEKLKLQEKSKGTDNKKIKEAEVLKEKPEEILENSNEKSLESLARNELVKLAKEYKIKNYSRLTKKDLIKAINKYNKESKLNLMPKAQEKISIEDLSGKDAFKAKDNPMELVLDSEKETTDFSKLSRQELVEIARKLKIKNYSRLNKLRLIKLIEESNKLKVSEKKEVKVSGAEKSEPEKQSETIEKIANNLESSYIDKREAKTIEDELKHKILLKPSRFPKSKTNKEFLFEDEENLELPELEEEDKVTLLPVDPYKVFVYWNLKSQTLDLIKELNLKNLVIKVNDVTNIIYNGLNANYYWFENCLALSRNWYINMNEGDKNICVEIGYINKGFFNLIARSNTIYVPRGYQSPVINDKFVIVNYPEAETRTLNKEGMNLSKLFISRIPAKNDSAFHQMETYKKVSTPKTKKIPSHFVNEYEISGKPASPEHNKSEDFRPKAPVKITNSMAPQEETVQFNDNHQIEQAPNKINFVPEYFDETDSSVFQPEPILTNDYQSEDNNSIIRTNETISNDVRNQFEKVYEFDNQVFIDNNYYMLPNNDNRIIKVYYQWYEKGEPFKKEIYWVSDSIPQLHDKIYRISWGPVWIKEFVGGSERIRYLGASERFLGGSELFLGGSEQYLGGSDRWFLGGSEMYQGASERFTGASERFLGGSESLYPGASDRMALYGNENYPFANYRS